MKNTLLLKKKLQLLTIKELKLVYENLGLVYHPQNKYTLIDHLYNKGGGSHNDITLYLMRHAKSCANILKERHGDILNTYRNKEPDTALTDSGFTQSIIQGSRISSDIFDKFPKKDNKTIIYTSNLSRTIETAAGAVYGHRKTRDEISDTVVIPVPVIAEKRKFVKDLDNQPVSSSRCLYLIVKDRIQKFFRKLNNIENIEINDSEIENFLQFITKDGLIDNNLMGPSNVTKFLKNIHTLLDNQTDTLFAVSHHGFIKSIIKRCNPMNRGVYKNKLKVDNTEIVKCILKYDSFANTYYVHSTDRYLDSPPYSETFRFTNCETL
jgi:broad specificity phosphatase PhoE